MLGADLNDFTNGWIVGNFEPSLLKIKDLEVGIKQYVRGEREVIHYQKTATEITVVIEGKVRLNENIYSKRQICIIPPKIAADFECIEDATLVCLKYPSVPQDKTLGLP